MLNKQSLAILGSFVVLAAFSVLAGCRHKTHIVRLIVHGPVVTASTQGETTILAPADPEHLLVAGYPSVGEAISAPCSAGAYEFKLDGIKPAQKRAGASGEQDHAIDPAFRPITVKISPNWKPLGQPYFVTMHLPAAERIVALGPRYKVQFAGSSDPDFVPLTQMLEFEVRDSDDVRLVQTCGSDKKEYKALTCKEMRAKYDEVFRETMDQDKEPDSERDYIDFVLKSCADDTSYLFVGIGLDPRVRRPLGFKESHGRDYFNNKVLPELFGGAANVPPGRKLVPQYKSSPGSSQSDGEGEARMIRTSFGGNHPRYVPVLLTENCSAPGGMGSP